MISSKFSNDQDALKKDNDLLTIENKRLTQSNEDNHTKLKLQVDFYEKNKNISFLFFHLTHKDYF